MRIFNEYNFGSYLLFNDIKVFIDSRADLYEKNFNHSKRSIVEDAMEINRKNYNEIFKYYDITHILLYNTNFICDYLKKDENYKIIYKDESTAEGTWEDDIANGNFTKVNTDNVFSPPLVYF